MIYLFGLLLYFVFIYAQGFVLVGLYKSSEDFKFSFFEAK